MAPFNQRKVNCKVNYGYAGMGGSRKQMLFCNGADTGLDTWHASAPTSNWSKMVREFGEPNE
jgi:hypothetical protein